MRNNLFRKKRKGAVTNSVVPTKAFSLTQVSQTARCRVSAALGRATNNGAVTL
jgi:hypothetical protein